MDGNTKQPFGQDFGGLSFGFWYERLQHRSAEQGRQSYYCGHELAQWSN